MGAGPPPKPAEAPQILERGPPTRNVTAPEESEKEKADTEREKPDSDTESDVDDPYVFFCRVCIRPSKHTQFFYSHFTDQIWTIPHMTVKIAVIQLCGFTDKWILIEVHVSMWQLTGNN